MVTILCALTMSSCKDSADNPVAPANPTPEEQVRKDVIGTWVDTVNVELLGCAKVIDLREDGTLDLAVIGFKDNEDGVTDEDDILILLFEGRWKAIIDLKDRWSGADNAAPLKALALELTIEGFEEYGLMPDTLLVERTPEGLSFITTDEADMIAEYLQSADPGTSAIRTRGWGVFGGDFWKKVWNDVIKPTGKAVINSVVIKNSDLSL